MDRAKMLFAMALFFAPIAVDLVAAALRGKPRYRLNDLIANLTLMLLTVVGSALIAVLTLWIYVQCYDALAVVRLSASSPVTWLVAFFAYDFFYYWAHRIHHEVAVLWGVHVVHHSGEDMNFGLAVRQSALGGLTTWIFFLPMAIAGIPAEVYLGIAGLQLLYQYFIHNTYVPALGWLEHVLVTPSQHRVHHGRNQPYIDKNYGNILVVWDRLFGTYQAELPEHRAVYGLRHSPATWNPMTLHTHAFTELAHKAAACARPLDKLRCFLRGPSWRPPSLDPARYTEADDGPSATFVRYDPPVPTSRAIYCAAQLAALTAAVVLLIWNLNAMTAGAIAAAVGFIAVSAWSLGGLLDGAPAFWRLELVRLAAVAGLGAAVALHDGLGAARALVAAALIAVASGLYLVRFRPGFVAGASSAEPGRGAVTG